MRTPREEAALAQFGKNVRRLREQRDLTQAQLASLAGLDRTYLNGVERGRRNPTLDVVIALAAALQVSMAEIYDSL